MRAPIHVIGMTEAGLDGLAPAARAALDAADLIWTSERLKAALPKTLQRRAHVWPKPFALPRDAIATARAAGRHVAVLASGDPFHFGIGSLLAAAFGPEALKPHPAPSAFALAAARLGWPLQRVETLSLHGRPVELLHRHLRPAARLLLLTAGAETAQAVGELLSAAGFGGSTTHVLAHLDGPQERHLTMPAHDLATASVPDLHVLALELAAEDGAVWWPLAPGLPDDMFVHDGQLSKRHVRAMTIPRLLPAPGRTLIDIGAGCGGICVEWLRLAGPDATAHAIERDAARCEMIAANARRLGAPHLRVHHGEALDILAHLPKADALFLGGSVGDDALSAAARERLISGGALIAHAVTLSGQRALLAYQARFGGELARLSVETEAAIGPHSALKPALPVLQWVWEKS